MKLSEEALRLITAVKLYENYLDRNARMSWEDLRDKVDEAITYHLNPLIAGFKIKVKRKKSVRQIKTNIFKNRDTHYYMHSFSLK